MNKYPFPIQLPYSRRTRVLGQPTEIPWAMIAPHEAQAIRNHGRQDLQELARRHGLSACEAVAVLEDRRWHQMTEEDAVARLHQLIAEFTEKSDESNE